MNEEKMVTACENVCRDFSWATGFVNDLAPMIALAGAILLFFLQRRTDQRANERRLKQEVYRKYLRWLADNIGHLNSSDNNETETRFEIVRLRMEMMCIASDEVVVALKEVGEARENLSAQTAQNFAEAIAKLVLSMRRDGFPYTGISQNDIADVIEKLPFKFTPDNAQEEV
ncbi:MULTISPECIES: hypothetical protein [unclassified Ruegeria]|uniref:hypothetical protein n=1 Tax=unclassified Ruegeria TaxID=2625375 RepID=UPI001AD9C9CA|nr:MULTISPECIES: hypothetical protein [unclassified Ruegeria]MBO9411639.1 hypothetical protein [Ruegeria sp. R8_1]MBO9415799.1 hypothetical protein [Ruegeria sp. R8_2]